MNVTLPVGTSLKRGSDKLLQVEDVDPQDARDPHGLDDHRRHRQRPAQLGGPVDPAGQAARAEAAASARSRRRSARRSSRSPASRSRSATGRSSSRCSAPTRPSSRPRSLKLQEKVVEGARHRRPARPRCKPGIPAYAVRLKRDAVRELGLTTMQLAHEPARLRQRRRRHLLDLARRRAGRRRAAPAADLAREHRPARRPAGRLREGRHADRAGERRRRSCRW